jgi:hypothetical protein
VSYTAPKDALQRVQIGQSFAEYDLVRDDPNIFVATPASLVATQPDNHKCFFVGRRGSGKTAITYHILSKNRRAVSIAPQIFDLVKLPLSHEQFHDTRQRPFKSLVSAFERALLGELAKNWVARKLWHFSETYPNFNKERGLIEQCDFDTRVINLVEEIFEAFSNQNDKLWLRQIRRAEDLISEVESIRTDANFDFVFLIDRLDESWDGSDSAIICLMALMHACVHLRAACPSLRPYLFIRENIFSRIRKIDNEFLRLETSVVFLEWTEEKLTEFVERRCVRGLTTKPALGGEAWATFFEETGNSDCRKEIFNYCQNRPRDVLTYVSFAIELALSRSHKKITREDVQNACERFSTSKLKDLADEFSENYPNIRLVLELFYGLSTEYTLPAIENFIQKLLVDQNIAHYCGTWFYEVSQPQQFVGLFFSIGFFGLKDGKTWIYKSSGGDAAAVPALCASTTIGIHPAYHAALHLRLMVLPELSTDMILKSTGILEDLPQGVSFNDYNLKLKEMLDRLDYIEKGRAGATEFEDFVGELIKLCFFRALTNVQPKARNNQTVVIRDWIASNRAANGFWEVIRQKYDAVQVTWECKNYEHLAADDFHQVAYYMSNVAGRFVVIAYRALELDSSYYKHIERIAKDSKGMVLLLTEKDLRVFIRQAIKGKVREDHINEIFDRTLRAIG